MGSTGTFAACALMCLSVTTAAAADRAGDLNARACADIQRQLDVLLDYTTVSCLAAPDGARKFAFLLISAKAVPPQELNALLVWTTGAVAAAADKYGAGDLTRFLVADRPMLAKRHALAMPIARAVAIRHGALADRYSPEELLRTTRAAFVEIDIPASMPTR